MVNRDEIEIWGINQRLQTLQAVVANRVLDRVRDWVDRRIEIARGSTPASPIRPDPVARPPAGNAATPSSYTLFAASSVKSCSNTSPASRSRPRCTIQVPLHLQPAARDLGYRRGDFPVAEAQAEDIVTLPGHQFLTDIEIEYMIDHVRRFYRAEDTPL
jgi:dTDP-4-amino-4,6-dideoxygalactose transaminase